MNYNSNAPHRTKNDNFNSVSRIPQIRMGTKVSNSMLTNSNDSQQENLSGTINNGVRTNFNSASNIRNIPIQVRYTTNTSNNTSGSPTLYFTNNDAVLVQNEKFYDGSDRPANAMPGRQYFAYRQPSDFYTGGIVPPMSYNLRRASAGGSCEASLPFHDQPSVRQHHHSTHYIPQHSNNNLVARRFLGNLETVREHEHASATSGIPRVAVRPTMHDEPSSVLERESNTVFRVHNSMPPPLSSGTSLNISPAIYHNPSSETVNQSNELALTNLNDQRSGGFTTATHVVSESDVICGSSSDDDDEDGEDELVKGCGDEDSQPTTLSYGGEFIAASASSDESDDPELLELREREQIVEKYEKGPDGKDVDPWENPDFELYKVTDRFGFVHKSEAELTLEENERRRVERELKREQKWLRMLEEWKRRHPEKLPKRIWKGIPDKLRLVFWKRMLNVEDMKASAKANLYSELLMRARLISREVKQIDLDINRTYRDHLAFRRRYDVKQQSLFNVLAAYAMFNTEVGYCQGMSQIAAIFLMYMDEEDAFWCMHSLLANRKYSMHGFFVPGFPKLARFQNHYEKVIQKYLPKIKKHLDKAGIPNIHLTKWWFGCFLDRVPFALAIRVWDVFLYFGDCILIAMAYNIMKMHKKTIMKLQMEGFMEFIQQKLANDFGYTNDQVMESLEECLKKLQSDRMALPPPPNPDDPSEVPAKPLGPILTRSMVDIRMDIAEIHSRSSRANSVAGRSPALKRRHQKQFPAASTISTDPNPRRTPQSSTDANQPSSTSTTPIAMLNNADDSDAGKGQEIITNTDASLSLLADAFGQVPSLKKRQSGSRPLRPPPVPDADGFVPMSPRNHSIKDAKDHVRNHNKLTAAQNPGAQNVYNGNNSQRTKKAPIEPRRAISPSDAPSFIAPPDPETQTNNDPVVRAHSTRANRPSTSSITSLKKRQIGTGSLRHKTDARDLGKVVEMYHEQQKQLQQHLKHFSKDESIEETLPSVDDKHTSSDGASNTITEKPNNEQILQEMVHRTPDNVTYVSITNNNNSPEKPLPPTNIAQHHRHMPMAPLPYCPPPDYNNDDDRESGVKNRREHNRTSNNEAQLTRSRNAANVSYGGSLNRAHHPQVSEYSQSVHAYSNSHGGKYSEPAHMIPADRLPHHAAGASYYEEQNYQPAKVFNRQPVNATNSQPLGYSYNDARYDQRNDAMSRIADSAVIARYNNFNNPLAAAGFNNASVNPHWNTAAERYNIAWNDRSHMRQPDCWNAAATDAARYAANTHDYEPTQQRARQPREMSYYDNNGKQQLDMDDERPVVIRRF